ncbi:jg18458 [Pararge aegeria aegeria]|uniref:Jg18458 protein n=1 Tax=Pararge aegeria aegeria TaxID=348720 RepID=A0A8S4RP41_9NEOP|nr:jg18458 [Pararge aegeria aegeria]
MSHFKLKSSINASDAIPVNKYVSEKTGLTVIIANVEGPLVNGFFCLATEAHDDDGLPHTLEHLIFLGSQRYPYKGILDLLANRCMAHGTNAWTDIDHTCYTIYTAGDAGMLTLLPIYIDHILMPTLTEQGFITEVHHVNGEGEDAGVVYCEIQGRENSADTRCELSLLRAMYPNSGYSSDTGGIMKNLRTSTDNTKVRDFHKKFYRPENLTIILTGQIEADDVFKALATVEDDIIAKREREVQEEWIKPWQTIPPQPNYGELRQEWPADTEDCGQVMTFPVHLLVKYISVTILKY